MSVTAEKVENGNPAAWHCIDLLLGTTAVSQTNKATDFSTPGFPFEIVSIEASALTVTATISIDVQIDGASVLTGPITPVAASAVDGALGTAIRGGAASVLRALYTSNGTGAATNAHVRVWVRPQVSHETPLASVA